jgi:hypothetical protein
MSSGVKRWYHWVTMARLWVTWIAYGNNAHQAMMLKKGKMQQGNATNTRGKKNDMRLLIFIIYYYYYYYINTPKMIFYLPLKSRLLTLAYSSLCLSLSASIAYPVSL